MNTILSNLIFLNKKIINNNMNIPVVKKSFSIKIELEAVYNINRVNIIKSNRFELCLVSIKESGIKILINAKIAF